MNVPVFQVSEDFLSPKISRQSHLVRMMLTNPPSLPVSLSPDTSIQPILPGRVKPLELTLGPASHGLTGGPGQGVVPSMSLAGQQSLGEVSIHKTVIPPRTLSPPLCQPLPRQATAQGPPTSLLALLFCDLCNKTSLSFSLLL